MKRSDKTGYFWSSVSLIPGFVVVMIFICFFSTTALAHRVIIYGWVENDRVMTQSKFSSKRAVVGGEISVYGLKGNLLLSGRTGKKGKFDFQVPGRDPLEIVLNAGSGHRAKWRISKAELISGLDQHQHQQSKEPVPQKTGFKQEADACQRAELKAVVEDALDQKLRPVLKQLAESRERPVSVRDILGGIGYIVGLVGLAAYMRYRGAGGADT